MKLIEAITTILALVYFIDVQTEGKIDLPHINIQKICAKIGRKIKDRRRK